MGHETTTERKFGLMPEYIPRKNINVFNDAQTRKTYDGIDELSDSIETDQLMHPLILVELTLEDATEYVTELNALWQADYEPTKLAPNDRGTCFILVAGHRRLMAIDSLSPDLDSTVLCTLYQNQTLNDALRIQIAENTSMQLPPEREAHAITLYWKRNNYTTVAECAHDLGMSQKKVRNAIRFSQLPVEIQDFAFTKSVSYAQLLMLHPYMNALRKKLNEDGTARKFDEKEVVIMLTIVASKAREERMSNKALAEHVEGLVNDLTGVVAGLFDREQYAPHPMNRLETILRSLSTLATGDLRHTGAVFERDLVKGDRVLDPEVRRLLMQTREEIDRILRTTPAASD